MPVGTTAVAVATIFFASIQIDGHETTRVGPFADGGGCHNTVQDIKSDVYSSLDNSFNYGFTSDMWGGTGAIMRKQDYKIGCMSFKIDANGDQVGKDTYYK